MPELDLVSSGITLSAVAIFLWTQRAKVLEVVSRILDIQMTKSLERNSEILTEVYEYMNDILLKSQSVTNVAIVKYHNGMDKLTIHSNIHKTMIHELCSKPDCSFKETIQDIIVDSATLESLLLLISNNASNEEGKMTVIDENASGMCQRIYKKHGVKRYYSYCLYKSKAYYLVIHIYSDSENLIDVDEYTEIQLNSMKIGRLLTKR